MRGCVLELRWLRMLHVRLVEEPGPSGAAVSYSVARLQRAVTVESASNAMSGTTAGTLSAVSRTVAAVVKPRH